VAIIHKHAVGASLYGFLRFWTLAKVAICVSGSTRAWTRASGTFRRLAPRTEAGALDVQWLRARARLSFHALADSALIGLYFTHWIKAGIKAGTNPVFIGFPMCGCSSMVEQQPSKLNTRVRFPSPAPIIRADSPSCFPARFGPKNLPSLGLCSCGRGPLVNLTQVPRPSRPTQETSPANGCRRAHFGCRRSGPMFETRELSYRCRR
jgi:hypothetical protein